MPRIAVIYYSATGIVRALAEAVALAAAGCQGQRLARIAGRLPRSSSDQAGAGR